MSQLDPKFSPEEFLTHTDHLLSLGVKDSKHAFHQGVFATAQDSLIQQRYVVLRRWVLARRSLIFHTDIRSPKVKAIQQNPKTSFIFYSKNDRLQLRFECVSHVHHHNRLSRESFKLLLVPASVDNPQAFKLYPQRQGPEKVQHSIKIVRVLVLIKKSLVLIGILISVWP